jgi:hypothetical protein
MPAESDTMAHARTPLDGGDEVEESQHGTFPQAGVGLARLRATSLFVRSIRLSSDSLVDLDFTIDT